MQEQWLTYHEAAEALGIKVDSVKRRARARRWPRRTGNNGVVQVGIPTDALAEGRSERPSDDPSAILPAVPPPSAVADLQKYIVEAAEQRARADALADQVADLRADRDRLLSIIEKQASRTVDTRPVVGFWDRIFGRS